MIWIAMKQEDNFSLLTQGVLGWFICGLLKCPEIFVLKVQSIVYLQNEEFSFGSVLA